MSAVAVSSQERKLRPRRRAAPSPQARGINLLSARRPGREDRFPVGSRATRTSRRRQLEVRRAEKPGESAPGSRRGSAGGTERGGRRRVPAHPAAPAPPKAGAPRPLPQSWGRQKSPGNGGKKQEKGGTRAPGPPQARKPLGAVQPPPPAPARSAAATPGLPSLRSPRRAPTSSPDPTPQPTGEHSSVPLCQGYPRRPSPTAGPVARVVTQSATSATPSRRHPEARRVSERAAGSLPTLASASQLLVGRGSRLETLELIMGGCVWPSSSSLSENALLWQRSAVPPGGSEKRGVRGLAGTPAGGQAGTQAGNAPAGGWGCALGVQAAAAPGKVL